MPMPTVEVGLTINATPEVIAQAFTNPANAPYWNQDLERFEVISLEPGLVGSVARLHYRQGGRDYFMEDVLEEVIPNQYFKSRVSGNGIKATVETWIQPVKEGAEVRMRWSGRGTAFPLVIILPFMKSAIQRQTLQELETFKGLVERCGADFDHCP